MIGHRRTVSLLSQFYPLQRIISKNLKRNRKKIKHPFPYSCSLNQLAAQLSRCMYYKGVEKKVSLKCQLEEIGGDIMNGVGDGFILWPGVQISKACCNHAAIDTVKL